MLIAEVEIFKLFLLVFARFTGLMVSAPIIGSANFPNTALAREENYGLVFYVDALVVAGGGGGGRFFESGLKGDEKDIDAMATINIADLGYCNILHFKCAGSRSCSVWLTNGPIDNKDLT